jgi:nucleoside diphosphate kinase
MASSPDAIFIAEFTDPSSGLQKSYTLSYWKSDSSVSLFDRASKRTFMRRALPTEAEPLRFELLRPGASVMICGRPLKILSSVEDRTRGPPASSLSTLVLIKAYSNMPDILDLLRAAGCGIGRVLMLHLDADEAREFRELNEHASAESIDALQAEYMLAVEVVGPDCVATVQLLCGPADPKEAAAVAPQSIRWAGYQHEYGVRRGTTFKRPGSSERSLVE